MHVVIRCEDCIHYTDTGTIGFCALDGVVRGYWDSCTKFTLGLPGIVFTGDTTNKKEKK